MDTLIDALFTGDFPSLALFTGAAHAASGSSLRAGLMDESAARQAAKAMAGRAAPENLPVLEGLVLLWHDHWTPAHEIAQSREGEPGHDLLHAILHRREGDFANAGYWFRCAGKHACYPILERNLAAAEPARFRMKGGSGINGFDADIGGFASGIAGLEKGRWSPSGFLAAVRTWAKGAQASGNDGSESLALRRIQAEEFRAFAAHLLGA